MAKRRSVLLDVRSLVLVPAVGCVFKLIEMVAEHYISRLP